LIVPNKRSSLNAEPERNLYKEAFLNQYNILFFIFCFLASLIMRSIFPMVIFSGLELMYMLFVPDTELFKRYVAARYAEEDEERRRQAMEDRLRRLHIQQRGRYETLSDLVDRTTENMRKQQADAMHSSMTNKLETLRERFLWMMELSNTYNHYLSSVQGQDFQRTKNDLTKQIESTDSPRLKRTLQERLAVLEKRHERLEQVRENHTIVQNQIHTVEDIMRLIYESSMTMKNPQGISRQLDDLLIDVESTEESVMAFSDEESEVAFDNFEAELQQAIQEQEVSSRR
jgi:hypothetical protein